MNMAGWWKAGPQRHAAPPLGREHRLTEVAVIGEHRTALPGTCEYAPGKRVEKHELMRKGKPCITGRRFYTGMRLAECRLKKQQPVYLQLNPWSNDAAGAGDCGAAPGEADEVLYYHVGRKRRAGGVLPLRGNIVRGSGLSGMGNLTHERNPPVQAEPAFPKHIWTGNGPHYNFSVQIL